MKNRFLPVLRRSDGKESGYNQGTFGGGSLPRYGSGWFPYVRSSLKCMAYVVVLSIFSYYSGYIYLASVTCRTDNQKQEMEEGTVYYSYFAGTDFYKYTAAEESRRAMV